MKLFIFTIAFLFSTNSVACRVAERSPEERFKESKSVFIVRVVGISVPGLEQAEYDPSNIFREALITANPDMEIDIIVYKALKGKASLKKMTVPIGSCGGGFAKLAHVGILYNHYNDWYISHNTPDIENAKKH